MSVQIGEINSKVDLEGLPTAAPAEGAKKASHWEEQDRHRRVIEAERHRCERTAGEGFDG